MEILTLSDGTSLHGHCALAGDTLWFYLHDITFSDAFPIMNDPERTETVTSGGMGAERTYEGYTDLYCLRREPDGMITGGLKKAGE